MQQHPAAAAPPGPCCPYCPSHHEAQPPPPPGRLYTAIMTPVTLVSFLISLALVDARYAASRPTYPHHQQHAPAHAHPSLETGESSPALPRPGGRRRNADQDGSETYLHTRQRKMLRLEAEDAFRVRGAVVGVLGVMVLLGVWAAVWVVRAAWFAAARVEI
jgi:hypothetical protein